MLSPLFVSYIFRCAKSANYAQINDVPMQRNTHCSKTNAVLRYRYPREEMPYEDDTKKHFYVVSNSILYAK